ncbi:hypothetical protein N2152v2_009769 [Parachlorella kessleri]
MSGGPLRDLLSPGPSLTDNDPEDDEDFVASEGDDGSAAESDSESSSSSDEEGGSSSDSASQRSPEVAPEVLQALRAIQAQYDDVVFDEDILSESDISKQFPEEDEWEALRELESDADGPGDEPVGDEGPDSQVLAQQLEVQLQQKQQPPLEEQVAVEAEVGTAALATEAVRAAPDSQVGAVVGESDRQPAGRTGGPGLQQLGQMQLPLRLGLAGSTDASPGLPATSQQQAERAPAFQGEAPAAGAADWAAAAGAVGAAAAGGVSATGDAAAAGGAGGDVLAFGAVLGSLVGEPDDAIARRTRAHHPLTEFTLEELEELLQADEELEDGGRQDVEEYQRFLQSLRELPDLPPGFDLEAEEEEEEEDEDFAVELAGLLAGESGEDEKENRGQKRRRLAPRKPRAPRQRWVRRAEERQLESAAALRERRLRPLVAKGIGPLATGVLPQTLGVMAAALPELALGGAHRSLGGDDILAAAAAGAGAGDQLAARAPVVWRPPLDATAGGAKAGQAAPMYPSRSGPWLALAGAFQPAQYRQLHRLLHQHVQLLTQVYAMAAGSDGAQDAQVAQQAAGMLRELHSISESQTRSRQAAGIPAYDMDQLGLQPLPGLQPGPQEPAAADGTAPPFAPPRPLTDVHTIADLALLRQVPGLLGSLPLPAVGGTAGGAVVGTPAAAAPALSLPGGAAESDPAGTIAAAAAVVAAAAAAATAAVPELAEGEGAAGASKAGSRPEMEQAAACQLAAVSAPTAEPAAAGVEGTGRATDKFWAVESEEEKQRRRQKRRGRKRPKEHRLWRSLSAAAQLALTPLLPLYDPALTPQPLPFVPSTQLLFLPSEDELLALGLRRHGYDWKRIQEELLPTKTEGQLFNRKKNRVGGSVPSNCIKDVYQRMHAPLRPDECALLEQAVAFYGKQPYRWELICRNHLPHRHPNTLAVLWSQRTNGASVVKKKAQHKAAAATAGAAAQGMRPVFLSNMDDLPQQQQQQQQQEAATQPPGQLPAAGQTQPGSLPLLHPRRSPDGPGQQLHTLLHHLFPGMDVPFPLQLAAAVHACAAVAGVALPVPLLALVTPGAPPPPGMVPLGVVDWPALPAWQEAVALAQPRSAAAAQHAQQQQPQQQAGQEGTGPAAQQEGQQARAQEGLPGVHPASQPAALAAAAAPAASDQPPGFQPGNLTICSPARDIAAELQRLLTGEDCGGAERLQLPLPASAAAVAGGRPRRRRNDCWKSLFQGQGEAVRQQQGAAPASLAGTQQRQQAQQAPGAGHGSWGQHRWGSGGAKDPFQPLQLVGLPPAPAVTTAGAAGPTSHGNHAPDVPRGPGVAPPAAARQVAGKAPRKRVHFEFDREELEDSEEEAEGLTAAGACGGDEAAAMAAPVPACQVQQPLRPQWQSQQQRQRFDAEELSDSDDSEAQHSQRAGPSAQQQPTASNPVAGEARASTPGQAGLEGPAKGTRRQRRQRKEPEPKQPPRDHNRKTGDSERGAGPGAQPATAAAATPQPAVVAALQQDGMYAMPADQPLLPPADPAGGPAHHVCSQQPQPRLERDQPSPQQPPAHTRSASARQTRSHASGGRHTRSTAAAAAVPGAAVQHGRQQAQQVAAPVFEQDELPDSSDEDDGANPAQPAGRDGAPGGPSLGRPARPAASMPAAATRAQVAAAQWSQERQLSGQVTSAPQAAHAIVARAEPPAAEAPPLQAPAGLAQPAPLLGTSAPLVGDPSAMAAAAKPSCCGPAASPAAACKSRRVAAQHARIQITAWVSGGDQGPGQREQAPAHSTAPAIGEPVPQQHDGTAPSTLTARQGGGKEGKVLPGAPGMAAVGGTREGPSLPTTLPQAGPVPAQNGTSTTPRLQPGPTIRPSTVRAPSGAAPAIPSATGHAVVEGAVEGAASATAAAAAAGGGLANMPAAATTAQLAEGNPPPQASAPSPAQERAVHKQSEEAAASPKSQLASDPLAATQLGAGAGCSQAQPQQPGGAHQLAAQASGVGKPPRELAPFHVAVVPAAPPAAPGQDGQPPQPVPMHAVTEPSSSSGGRAWSKDEDRLLLKAVLAANGMLTAEHVEELLAQVGGEPAGRSVAAVEVRCAEVLERFTRLAQERKRMQPPPQQLQ